MSRFRIDIEYDGTNFYGWQKQRNQRTISAEIELAIKKFSGMTVEIYGSGRTDAGVHAKNQVAHFDFDNEKFNSFKIKEATNFYLKELPIVILDCVEVSENFHARFSAKKRSYEYLILNRYAKPALEINRVWHIKKPIDIDLMIKASKVLIGKHDFSSFRAAECQAKSAIKQLDKIEISIQGDKIRFYFEARSFLHHMVRNIVGSLIDLGTNKINYQQFYSGFLAKNRKLMGVTAPASGLFFLKAEY